MLTIFASEVAGFLGKHKWQQQHEVILAVLVRSRWVKADGWKPERQRQQEVMDLAAGGAQQMERFVRKRKWIDEEVVEETLEQAVQEKKITAVEKTQVDTRKMAQLLQGRSSEHQLVEKEKITGNNSQLLSLQISEDSPFKIVGRVDDYHPELKTLVEIKRRVRSPVHNKLVPFYDWVQCMVYMQMVQVQAMTLIELWSSEKKETRIENDAGKWQSEIEQPLVLLTTQLVQMKKQGGKLLQQYRAAVVAQQWSRCAQLLTPETSADRPDRLDRKEEGEPPSPAAPAHVPAAGLHQ